MTKTNQVEGYTNSLLSLSNVDGFWVIRAGINSECHELFLGKQVIALSDPKLGDLSNVEISRSSLRDLFIKNNDQIDARRAPGITGKFFRFVHEVTPGDFVLYPSLVDRVIYVGVVLGEYVFLSEDGNEFPHQRRVNWLSSFQSTSLSEACRREIGAARTFFRLLRAKEEVIRLIEMADRSHLEKSNGTG